MLSEGSRVGCAGEIVSVEAPGMEIVNVFRLFRGAGAEMTLVVGASKDSDSAAVAFCFPLLLLDIGEVGDGSGCDVLEPLINSVNWLWARRVLRERPSSTEESIIRSCSPLYYPKRSLGHHSFEFSYHGDQKTYLEEVLRFVTARSL